MDEFPPPVGWPQVTTEPSDFSAANAASFGNCLPLPVKKTAPEPTRSFGRIFGGLADQSAYWAWAGRTEQASKAKASKQAIRAEVRR